MLTIGTPKVNTPLHEKNTVDPSADEVSIRTSDDKVATYWVPFGTKSGWPPGVGDGHRVSRTAQLSMINALPLHAWHELGSPNVEWTSTGGEVSENAQASRAMRSGLTQEGIDEVFLPVAISLETESASKWSMHTV